MWRLVAVSPQGYHLVPLLRRHCNSDGVYLRRKPEFDGLSAESAVQSDERRGAGVPGQTPATAQVHRTAQTHGRQDREGRRFVSPTNAHWTTLRLSFIRRDKVRWSCVIPRNVNNTVH